MIFFFSSWSGAWATELLIVRGNENYPPNEMMFGNKLVGVHIDMIQEVARQLKWKFEFKSVAWSNAIDMMREGQADAITYVGKTPEREQFIYFDENNILSMVNIHLFARRNRAEKIHFDGNLKALTPYSIAVIEGYSYGLEFDRATFLNKTTVQSMEQLVQWIVSGKADFGIANKAELKTRVMQQLSNVIILKHPVYSSSAYIGFSKKKKHEALAKKFAATLSQFKQSSAYQKILRRYRVQQ